MKSALKLLIAGTFALLGFNAVADPIGGDSCGSCFGTTITLEYQVITATDYHITLTINTTGYNGPGGAADWIQAVAVKPASQLTGGSLISTTAPGTWTFQLGGLSSGSCDGSGSGFECASDGTTALTNGSTYQWVFDAKVSDSTKWLLADMAASVKVNFDSANQPNGLLTSEDITLQQGTPLPAPEPGTLALLGIGALALALGRRRRNS